MTRARRLRLRVFRVIVLLLGGAFFLVPIGAMFEFSTRGNRVGAPRTLEAWTTIVTYPDLLGAIRDSLGLAAITSVVMLVLLLPTMIWVRLRLPRLKRTIEFLCLLPLTIPAIVLVVGLSPVYLLSYLNLQVEIFQLGLANAGTSIAVSVASLMFAFILLVILSFFGRLRTRAAPERTGLPYPRAAAGPK